MTRARSRPSVFALGQALAGDDAGGLLVARRLRERGVAVREVPDGAALAGALAEVERAVVVDAVVGGGPAGAVVHLRGEELEGLRGRAGAGARRGPGAAGRGAVSSHGMSVPEAVAVARALGVTKEVELIGIAIDLPPPVADPTGPLPPVSDAVRAAIDEAAARVEAILAGEGRGDPRR